MVRVSVQPSAQTDENPHTDALVEVFEHLEVMNTLVWAELQTESISGLVCQTAEMWLSLPCCGVVPSTSTSWQLFPKDAQCSFGEDAVILCAGTSAGCSWHSCSIRVRTCDSTCLWEVCRTIGSEIASVNLDYNPVLINDCNNKMLWYVWQDFLPQCTTGTCILDLCLNS